MINLTPKQEKFAQVYIETGNASEAYRTAYPCSLKWKEKSVWEESSKLAAHPKVSSRLNQMKAAIAARHAVTVDSITAELDESRAMALEDRNPHAATQASLGKAKLAGLLEDKLTIKGKITAESGMDYLSAKYNVDIQKLIEESDRAKEINHG